TARAASTTTVRRAGATMTVARPRPRRQRMPAATSRTEASDASSRWIWRAPRRRRSRRASRRRRRAAPLLPAAQELPLLAQGRAQDRLQGREAPPALRLRTRQDRAEPHHRGVGEEAARPRPGDQARALPRPPPLCAEIGAARWDRYK